MPDDKNTQGSNSGEGEGAGQGSSSSTDKSNSDNRDGTQNAGKFDDPVARALALEKRLAERDAELERIKEANAELSLFRDKKLEEDGNWQEVAQNAKAQLEQYKPKIERLDTLVEGIRSRNKERIEALPEDKRKAVEKLMDKLSPEDLRDFLDEGSPLFQQAMAPGTDAGRGSMAGQTGQTALTEEQRKAAKRAGMSPEEYVAAMGKVNPPS